jgi:tetratricopeptide (TPR) repeat protein
VALIVIIALPIVRPEEAVPPGTAPVAGGGAGAVDLSTMTPREAADRLYERVMRADAAGDSAQVQMFLPMSVQAYAQARPLDPDGLFHLSLLLQIGGEYADGLAVAQEALEGNPDHLLNLGAAAQAAEGQGDVGSARAYWGRFLEVYDQEMAKGLPEYGDHTSWFDGARERALQATSN